MFEEDALQWEEKLNRIHDVFDVWIDVQRRWVYLDGIFSGSADIKALLPVETQRFQRCVFFHFQSIGGGGGASHCGIMVLLTIQG